MILHNEKTVGELKKEVEKWEEVWYNGNRIVMKGIDKNVVYIKGRKL